MVGRRYYGGDYFLVDVGCILCSSPSLSARGSIQESGSMSMPLLKRSASMASGITVLCLRSKRILVFVSEKL